MIKILDLFCGIGGTAKGIQESLFQHWIFNYEYIAIDNDINALRNFELNNKGKTIYANAFSFLYDLSFIEKFSFIWLSPECQNYSRANPENRFKTDPTLWDIINFYQAKVKIPYVIENVLPINSQEIEPTCKINRHLFYSNLPLKSSNLHLYKPHKDFMKMSVAELSEWKKLKVMYGEKNIFRKYLRNALYFRISEHIFDLFLAR